MRSSFQNVRHIGRRQHVNPWAGGPDWEIRRKSWYDSTPIEHPSEKELLPFDEQGGEFLPAEECCGCSERYSCDPKWRYEMAMDCPLGVASFDGAEKRLRFLHNQRRNRWTSMS